MFGPTNSLANEYQQLCPAALIERAVLCGEGELTNLGALVVTSDAYTEKTPANRFIVEEPSTREALEWSQANQTFTSRQFDDLWSGVSNYLADRDTYSTDLHVGQDLEYYLPIHLKTETAWHNLVGQTLYSRPSTYNPKNKEVWSILHAAHFECDPVRDGTQGKGAVIIHFGRRKILLAGLLCAGEIKKALLTVQNFLLPEKDVLPLHCAANIGSDGAVCLFLGASGAGKTILSLDSSRALIGDDEHAWGKDTLFNLENGCYAKCLNLSEVNDPEISQAIRFGALIENVVIDPTSHLPDFANTRLTHNSRACYPLSHINHRFRAITAPEPTMVIMLVHDLSGLLPIVAQLSHEAATYHFLTGYSNRLDRIPQSPDRAEAAGAEVEDKIVPVFSPCFCAPCLPRPATLYADLFLQRLKAQGAQVYLVNTGWYGGPANEGGKPISRMQTRRVISAIHQGEILGADATDLQPLNLTIPSRLEGIDSALLDPRRAWPSVSAYEQAANRLAALFVENFKQYSVDDIIINAGPRGPAKPSRAL